MNNTPIKTPTLAEFTAVGYVVDINHVRVFDTAEFERNKLRIGTMEATLPEIKGNSYGTALRAKGGRTDVYVTDPETSAEFYGYAKCHPDDNYDKKEGIKEALKRVAALMLVTDGVDGFKCRLQF